MLDDLIHGLTSETLDIDSCCEKLSDIIYNISFQANGKTFHVNSNRSFRKTSPWFDNDCKRCTAELYIAKRAFMNIVMLKTVLVFLKVEVIFVKLNVKLKMFTTIKKNTIYPT